ncbi:MAG: family metallopeptidase [Clostridia bacterium]|nr:family metallopeptidase [Clostridia bacterium]
MKKITIFVMLLCLFAVAGCEEKETMQNIASMDSRTASYDVTMKRDLLCLMMAYPEYITDVKREINGSVYVIMKSGKRILYDDKKEKNHNEKLANADLQDMMEQIYPLSDITNLMAEDFDPGRARVYALLKEVYGGSKGQVEKNLIPVKVGYKNYSFNRNNKAAEALQSVMKELVLLTEKRQDIRSCVFPASGTFNYRVIAGTNQLSAHSFGIAIDLASDKRDYWKWTSRKEGERRLNSYPREIVQIFEKNNFIWGGKWDPGTLRMNLPLGSHGMTDCLLKMLS